MTDAIRTQIRTGIEQALDALKTTDTAYFRTFSMSRTWDSPDETTQYPHYCVIVTDETIDNESHAWRRCLIDGVVVIYVKDPKDPRSMLDRAIEDVWSAITSSLTLGGSAREVTISDIQCDDGTKIAKPYAQAVLRWVCTITRPRRPIT